MLLLVILRRCSDEAAYNGMGLREADIQSWPVVLWLHNGWVSHHSTGFESVKATLLINAPDTSVQYISVHFTAAALIYVWLPELKKVHSVCDVLYQHWSYILTHHYSILPQRHLSVPLPFLEMSAAWLAHGIKSTHRKIMSLWQQRLAYVSPQWHAQSQTLH